MKNNSIKYVNIIVILSLFSCGFFNEEIIEVSPQKSKIVIFAEIVSDSQWSQAIVLSRTRNLNQKFDFDFTYGDTIFVRPNGTAVLNTFPIILLDTVKGAKIKLSSQNMEVANFKQTDPFAKSFYEISNLNLREGELCKLQISAPDFDTVFAEQYVPESAKLSKVLFTRNSYQSIQSGTLSELILEFNNNTSTMNYYTVDIYIKKKEKGDFIYVRPNIIKIDPNADTPLFLNSNNFKGNRYAWRIGVDLGIETNKSIPTDFVDLLVVFRSTSKDYNEYAKNLEATKNANNNLFSEPITPFSNIKNGYGVFIVSGKPDTISVPIR